MLTVAPVGVLSQPLQYLRELIAASPTWQQWCDTDNEATAQTRIYPYAISNLDPQTNPRPYATIYLPQGAKFSRGAFHQGMIDAIFEADINSDFSRDATDDLGGDPASALYDFTNRLGAIIQEMWDESEKGGRLLVTSVDILHPAMRSSARDGIEDYFQMGLRFFYGAQTR